MDRVDGAIASVSALLRSSAVPHPPSMPCAAPRGIAPMLGSQVSPHHRGRDGLLLRRVPAGPHGSPLTDELGPMWRAARSRGVAPDRSSVGRLTAVDRGWPAGNSASRPAPHHAP